MWERPDAGTWPGRVVEEAFTREMERAPILTRSERSCLDVTGSEFVRILRRSRLCDAARQGQHEHPWRRPRFRQSQGVGATPSGPEVLILEYVAPRASTRGGVIPGLHAGQGPGVVVPSHRTSRDRTIRNRLNSDFGPDAAGCCRFSAMCNPTQDAWPGMVDCTEASVKMVDRNMRVARILQSRLGGNIAQTACFGDSFE